MCISIIMETKQKQKGLTGVIMENNVNITVKLDSGDSLLFDGFDREVEEKLLTYLNTDNPTSKPIYFDYEHGVLSKVQSISIETDENKHPMIFDANLQPKAVNDLINAMVVDNYCNLNGINVLSTIEQHKTNVLDYDLFIRDLENKLDKGEITKESIGEMKAERLLNALNSYILDDNFYAKKFILDTARKDTDVRLINYLSQPEFIRFMPELASAIRENEDIRKIVIEQVKEQEREQPKQYSRFQLNYTNNLSNIGVDRDTNRSKGKDI